MVDAFFAAARECHFDALVAVLDPDVILRFPRGAALPEQTATVNGAEAVARPALIFAQPGPEVQSAIVNGGGGLLVRRVLDIEGDLPVANLPYRRSQIDSDTRVAVGHFGF